jgi:hypothetical protein
MQVALTFPHANSVTLQDVLNYMQSALSSFERHPSITDYERGYEAAIRDMRTDLHLDR